MSRYQVGIANQPSDRRVVLAAGTTNLTPQEHANRLLTIDTAGSLYTLNLPRATGSGDVYEFLSTTTRTSNVVINAVGTAPSNKFVGTIYQQSSGNFFTKFSSTTNDIITLNQTTTGGAAAGDYLKIVDTAPDQWRVVLGLFNTSGAQATPFSG
jgi:hypothetical protein